MERSVVASFQQKLGDGCFCCSVCLQPWGHGDGLVIVVVVVCKCAPVPVKNCLFICSTGLINGSLIAYQSDLGLVPWILAIKRWTQICISSFQEDTRDMGWARGRRWGKYRATFSCLWGGSKLTLRAVLNQMPDPQAIALSVQMDPEKTRTWKFLPPPSVLSTQEQPQSVLCTY